MAILGEPDSELEDMLSGIEEVQQAARKQIKAGAIGSEIYAAAEAVLPAIRIAPTCISAPTAWAS